jgi:hypothetical protein
MMDDILDLPMEAALPKAPTRHDLRLGILRDYAAGAYTAAQALSHLDRLDLIVMRRGETFIVDGAQYDWTATLRLLEARAAGESFSAPNPPENQKQPPTVTPKAFSRYSGGSQ